MFKITLVFSFISLACSHAPISKVAEASITASPLGAKINKNFQVLKEKYLLGGSRLNYQNPVLCFKNNKKKMYRERGESFEFAVNQSVSNDKTVPLEKLL